MDTPLTIESAKQKLHAKEISAVEIVQSAISEIKTWEPRVHAYLETFTEEALALAQAADKNIAAGKTA
ncbi:MAG: Asp-tRNA(Asn)/Glu-tRNA(Gln) amidotransferase subunit GatA, partial [Candidatus Andersenbacteria bacterium]|nr:Asp-tRNA(Asn)/Glu-tRNA(Gln) amidotransferase subunit GatA [Candidatus Andersenbacteria bacterium]